MLFHTFLMDSVSWLHSPTCTVCGYQLADSEAFQVLAIKQSKDTVEFWQTFISSVRDTYIQQDLIVMEVNYGAHQAHEKLTQWGQGERVGYRIYSNGRRTPFSSRPRIDAASNYIHYNTFRGCGNESMRTCPLVPACPRVNAWCDK